MRCNSPFYFDRNTKKVFDYIRFHFILGKGKEPMQSHLFCNLYVQRCVCKDYKWSTNNILPLRK